MTARLREAAPPFAGAAFPSPLGPLEAVVDSAGALVALSFARDGFGPARAGTWRGHAVARDPRALAAVRRQLDAYFARRRRDFDLDLAPIGTAFLRAVWRELTRIPWGGTISYAELARRVGRPSATRAVGRANGLNPVAIVIPCHRVIGADGTLTGYAGGLDLKAALLALEGGRLPRQGELALAAAAR